ncbi:MAG: agmatine deiminase family protein [Thermoanaerobaculia bacterium]|nr:agmatine deiminase family protein [Thermoanaerobaculia bacterium]
MKSSNTGLRCAAALGLCMLSASTRAQEAVAPPPAEEAAPLPAGLAPFEVGVPLPAADTAFAPPTGAVFTPAEYARNKGLLLRWTSGFENELSDITVAISTLDPSAIVTIVVSGSSQQNSANSTLTSAGADLSQVQFLVAASNSVWMRDYGPRFILEDKQLAIVDHVYNRPRPQDDTIPGAVATAWALAKYDIPLTHGGGNFHLFQNGEAFMTELILDENPGLSEATILNDYALYQNLDVTIFPGFPEQFDSTRHIDMWMLPVRDKVVIIGEYPVGAGAPRTITEDAVATLEGRGYTVFRTPGWGGNFQTHFTYTNAVVFNRLVLVPQYSGHSAENAQAIAVYQQAFPGRQILGIDGTDIVGLAGVFHCIVMHVPDPLWIFEDDFETANTSVWSSVTPP